ncbi:MAG: tetratricopeptide repeat protein [Myxococcota bacterium]|jgi:tetratricopeptide (TPR) repeat protein/CHAT domain-containing protein|nr:tetratricopeptide repeat protein [Myxococcota bacterium]
MKLRWLYIYTALLFMLCSCRGADQYFSGVKTYDFIDDPLFAKMTPVVEAIADDILPVTHPRKGNILIYVSSSKGNMDLYKKDLKTNKTWQLTTHPTDDTEPSFSPDGQWLAWTSQKNDVKGDIWIMKSDGSKAQKLTHRQMAEYAPIWGPQGKYIYFVAQANARSGQRIERIDLKTKKRDVIIEQGWAPTLMQKKPVLIYFKKSTTPFPQIVAHNILTSQERILTSGTTIDLYPRVLPYKNNEHLVFSRYVDDHNDDGIVSKQDKASLWSIPLTQKVLSLEIFPTAIPLTPGEKDAFFPCANEYSLFFTRKGLNGFDIVRLPLGGLLNPNFSLKTLLQRVREIENPLRRKFILRVVLAQNPDYGPRAHYELAREYVEREKYIDAIDELQKAKTQTKNEVFNAINKLEILRLGYYEFKRSAALSSLDQEQNRILESIKKVARTHPEQQQIQGRYHSIKAKIQEERGRLYEATRSLYRVVKEPQSLSEDKARAWTALTQIFLRLKNTEAFEHAAIQLLTTLPTERYYTLKVAKLWIEQLEKDQSPESLPKLETLITKYPHIPLLTFLATNALARAQAKNNFDHQAINTWLELIKSPAKVTSVYKDALLSLAKKSRSLQRDNAALDAYENLAQAFGHEKETVSKAELGITELSFKRASIEEKSGNYSQARNLYLRLLRNRWNIATAHRRFVRVSAKLDKLKETEIYYKKRLERNEGNAFTHYGLALVLTHKEDTNFIEPEKHIRLALKINPRLAEAHLTLGWIRLQREHSDPNKNWLEKADNSFATAEQLIEKEAQPELAAAIDLNKGHTLYALGKTDEAFKAFLARELNQTPFSNKLNELIFREFFARASLREEEYDVGIDMAKAAVSIARELPGQPRYATNLALVGALFLLNKDLESALQWLDKAEDIFRQQELYAYCIPLLRDKILIHRHLNQYPKAITELRTLLTFLAEGYEPALSPAGDSSWLTHVVEIEVDPENISRAIYGFNLDQEKEIANALSTQVWLKQGDLNKASFYNKKRIEILNDALDGTQGHRIKNEFLFALNESALVHVKLKQLDKAYTAWKRAVDFAFKHQYWEKAIVLLESLNTLWSLYPEMRQSEKRIALRHAAQDAYAQLSEKKPELAKRYASFIALESLAKSHRPKHQPLTNIQSLHLRLTDLDHVLADRENALNYAALSGDPHLKNIAEFLSQDGEEINQENQTWMQLVDYFVAQQEIRPAENIDWTLIDRALAKHEETGTPAHHHIEERILLKYGIERLIEQKHIEQAFLLAEKAQLKDLALIALSEGRMSPRRASDTSFAAKLEQAIKGIPNTPKEIQKSLKSSELFIKFFVDTETLHWVKISSNDIKHIKQKISANHLDTLLAADLKQQTDSSGNTTVYLDRLHLPQKVYARIESVLNTISPQPIYADVLSATYYLVSKELNYINSSGHLKIGGPKTSLNLFHVNGTKLDENWLKYLPENLRLFEIDLPTIVSHGSNLSGSFATINFQSQKTARQLGLYEISKNNIRSALALLTLTKPTQEVKKALALSFLLAGTPSVVIANNASDALRTAFATPKKDQNFGEIIHEHLKSQPNTRLSILGTPGISKNEEVDFAQKHFLTLARNATRDFKRAQKKQSHAGWKKAKDSFYTLINTIDFLLQPHSLEALKNSQDPLGKRLPAILPKLSRDNRKYLSEIHLLLKEYEQSIALQESVIQAFKNVGDTKEATTQMLSLGRIHLHTGKLKKAITTFTRCVQSALPLELTLLAGKCLTFLGTAQRRLFLYKEAEQAYHQALAVYGETEPKEQIKIKRLLGLVYESGFSQYQEAIIYFNDALLLAKQHHAQNQHLTLLLDIARVHRQKGSYSKAFDYLNEIQQKDEKISTKYLVEADLEAAKNYWYQGNYRLAQDFQQKALENARRNSNSFLKIQALSLGGLIALNQGELINAEQRIKSALSLSRNTHRLNEEAVQLNNLGIVYRQKGELINAENAFAKALSIDKKLGSPEGKAYDLRNLGINFFLRGDIELAQRTLEDALQLSREIGNNYNEVQTLVALGRLMEKKSPLKGLALYQEATEKALLLNIPEAGWLSYFGQGRIQQKLGKLDIAKGLYSKAIKIAQTLTRRGDVGSGQLGRDDLYAQSIKLAITLKDHSYAFKIMELARLQEHFDIIKGLSAEQLKGRRLRLLGRALKANEQQQMTKALQNLAQTSPILSQAILKNPVEFDDFKKNLDEKTLAISYFMGNKNLYVLTFDKAQSLMRTKSIDKKDFQKNLLKLRNKLNAFAPVNEDLHWLSEHLLLPDVAQWANKERLIVLPQGDLALIPFSALMINGKAMMDYWMISHAPHATFLNTLLGKKTTTQKVKRVRALAADESIPFAKLEAQAVGTRIINPERLQLRPLLSHKGTDALHIAAHSKSKIEDLLGQELILSSQDIENSRIKITSILNAKKSPSLVTLSACNTASSFYSSEKHLSLKDAFFIAGARTVIGTLSRVSDLSTAIFMKQFYRQAKQDRVEKAFHQAKHYIRERYPHPSYWASMVISGDYR